MARIRPGTPPRTGLSATQDGREKVRKRRLYYEDGTVVTQRRISLPTETANDGGVVTDNHRSSQSIEGEGAVASHTREKREGPKERIVVSIDLGTNNTIVGVLRTQRQDPGYNITYVQSYPDSPELVHTMPTVPSRLEYDKHHLVVNWGYQVSDTCEEAVRWFKLLLTSDDMSAARQAAETSTAAIGLDEETVMGDYVQKIFEATLDHISADPSTYRITVMAALPSRSDQLALERYEQILNKAAAKVGFNVDGITIYSEALAVARSCLSMLNNPGLYFLRIHDGGGGTTDFTAMIARLFPDGSVQRETLHEPRYLSCGGEDLDAGFQTFIRRRYPEASPAQLAAFRRLWHQTLKVKASTSWKIDADLKLALPSDFVLDESTAYVLQQEVIGPPIERIVQFLLEEDASARRLFQRRFIQVKERDEQSPSRRRARLSMWDIENSITSLSSTTSDRAPSEDHLYTADELVHCEQRFISSGGQSYDITLQQRLKQGITPTWERSPRARVNVAEGLLHLYRDAQTGRRRLPVAKSAYGYLGWNETTKAPTACFDRVLGTYQRESPSLLIRIGADVSVGQLFSRPGHELCFPDSVPEWPEELVIQQFTTTDLDAWQRHKSLPRQARKILTLRFPQREVPSNLYTKRSYPKDQSGPAIEMNVAEYQVTLKIEHDGLSAQVSSTVQPDKVLASSRSTFQDLNLSRADL